MPRKMGKRGLFPAAFLPGAFLPIALSNVVLLAAAAGVVGLSPGSLSGLVAPGPDRMKPDRMKDVPNIVLWAWERPEDLEFLPPRKVGVAFLARTLYLRGDELLQYPRLQPLRLPPGAAPIAVVRIESDRAQPPELSEEQQLKAVSAIAEVAAMRCLHPGGLRRDCVGTWVLSRAAAGPAPAPAQIRWPLDHGSGLVVPG